MGNRDGKSEWGLGMMRRDDDAENPKNPMVSVGFCILFTTNPKNELGFVGFCIVLTENPKNPWVSVGFCMLFTNNPKNQLVFVCFRIGLTKNPKKQNVVVVFFTKSCKIKKNVGKSQNPKNPKKTQALQMVARGVATIFLDF